MAGHRGGSLRLLAGEARPRRAGAVAPAEARGMAAVGGVAGAVWCGMVSWQGPRWGATLGGRGRGRTGAGGRAAAAGRARGGRRVPGGAPRGARGVSPRRRRGGGARRRPGRCGAGLSARRRVAPARSGEASEDERHSKLGEDVHSPISLASCTSLFWRAKNCPLSYRKPSQTGMLISHMAQCTVRVPLARAPQCWKRLMPGLY